MNKLEETYDLIFNENIELINTNVIKYRRNNGVYKKFRTIEWFYICMLIVLNYILRRNVFMKCSKCGSENVNVQMVSESQLKTKHHGLLYWLLIGWWLQTILWIFLTLPMLLSTLFGHKKQKLVTKHKSMAVCQNCGNTWDIK